MKQDIHPRYTEAQVVCSGCGTRFQTRATVDNIEVEICSQCHPFYTGKQKLVDVAGRVDRFRAKQQQATNKRSAKKPASKQPEDGTPAADQGKKQLSDLKDLQQ